MSSAESPSVEYSRKRSALPIRSAGETQFDTEVATNEARSAARSGTLRRMWRSARRSRLLDRRSPMKEISSAIPISPRPIVATYATTW